MKVLQINCVCGIGSTGRIAVDLYNTLLENGDDCVIAYGRGKAPENIKTIKCGGKLNSYIHYALTRAFDLQCRSSIIATKKLVREIKKYDPDVIHLHNIHGYYLNMKILFKYLEKANKQIVWTLHDCWPFTGHCAYFTFANCSKWLTECKKCPNIRDYPGSLFLDKSKTNYKIKKKIFNGCKDMVFITPSKWLADLQQESFLKKYNVYVINNGINLDNFKPCDNKTIREKYNLGDKFVVLGVASEWTKRKGLNYFIELSKMLNSEYKIILVGINEETKKAIPNNIMCISRTNNVGELAELYSVADVFVNPTLEDNFPTTNIEALACGTPVITFETGGSPESINDTCGIVVKQGDTKQLCNAIKKCKQNNFTKEDCLKQSSKFDKESKYKEYIELYKKLLNEK